MHFEVIRLFIEFLNLTYNLYILSNGQLSLLKLLKLNTPTITHSIPSNPNFKTESPKYD